MNTFLNHDYVRHTDSIMKLPVMKYYLYIIILFPFNSFTVFSRVLFCTDEDIHRTTGFITLRCVLIFSFDLDWSLFVFDNDELCKFY